MTIKIFQGNCLDKLKELPKQSINTCITSPPYWGLRDYQKDEQFGLEETPEEFVNNLVKVFREVKRVLTDDGTVWLNLGDTFLKNKQLACIPFKTAIALQQDGWYLRQDIIWHKPNPFPESVTDRCTKAHEYIFLLSKSSKYYFDNEAIKEDCIYAPNKTNEVERAKGYYKGKWSNPEKGSRHDGSFKAIREKRNKRSVWTVATKSFKDAHFATFPMDLIEPCVLAGCPEKVCVECGTSYQNKPIYKYIKDTEQNNLSHGKYNNQKKEMSNRQGMHSNRGKKLIEIRDNLPKQKKIVNFLKKVTTPKILAANTNIPLTKIEHWFRNDENGFSYPSIEDWYKIKDLVNDWSLEYEDINKKITDVEHKTDAVISKKITGYKLEKQCDCETNETKAGTVLDPFGGSGTTGIVANNHNRNAILIELNKEYIEIAKKRIDDQGSMFTDLEIIGEENDR